MQLVDLCQNENIRLAHMNPAADLLDHLWQKFNPKSVRRSKRSPDLCFRHRDVPQVSGPRRGRRQPGRPGSRPEEGRREERDGDVQTWVHHASPEGQSTGRKTQS